MSNTSPVARFTTTNHLSVGIATGTAGAPELERLDELELLEELLDELELVLDELEELELLLEELDEPTLDDELLEPLEPEPPHAINVAAAKAKNVAREAVISTRSFSIGSCMPFLQ